MTPWANMHGGFIFGLMLIGPFALEAVTEVPAEARFGAARAWVTFALVALAAAITCRASVNGGPRTSAISARWNWRS
jgi:hypothetical protein